MDDLKPLLVQLLDKVDAIHTDVTVLKSDVAGLKTDVAELKSDVAELKTGQARLEDRQAKLEERQARLEDDNRQIKEMVGIARMRDIARLDGRIDQLAQIVMQGQKASG